MHSKKLVSHTKYLIEKMPNNVHLVTPRKLSTVRSLMDLKLRGVNYK